MIKKEPHVVVAMVGERVEHDDYIEVGIGHSEATVEQDFGLPDDFRQLAAMTATAKAKMDELQTTRAQSLKTKWTMEADALGLTPDEVLHGTSGKKRGRRPKPKHGE